MSWSLAKSFGREHHLSPWERTRIYLGLEQNFLWYWVLCRRTLGFVIVDYATEKNISEVQMQSSNTPNAAFPKSWTEDTLQTLFRHEPHPVRLTLHFYVILDRYLWGIWFNIRSSASISSVAKLKTCCNSSLVGPKLAYEGSIAQFFQTFCHLLKQLFRNY